jgi:hypothetical protein
MREEVPANAAVGQEWGEMHAGDAAVAALARRR